MAKESWTLVELHEELKRFQMAPELATLKPASVRTYVEAEKSVHWLGGQFEFRGPHR
jgi:hypothetical protein